jgi:glutaredoxin 3
MTKTLYWSTGLLFFFLIYTVCSQDLALQDIREYDNRIIIYSKAKCTFCTGAKNLLYKKGIHYSDIDITWDKELHDKLKRDTQQFTVPYIFINQKFIGGYQDLVELEKTKKLDKLLQETDDT